MSAANPFLTRSSDPVARQSHVAALVSEIADLRSRLEAIEVRFQVRAKLTPEMVREARARRRAGETYKAIGDRLGVSGSSIYRVCSGISWREILDVEDGGVS